MLDLNIMKKLKVLLINPICASSISELINDIKIRKINADEPLGLAYISSWIRKKMPEIEIQVYDHHIDSLQYFYETNEISEKIVFNLLKDKISLFSPEIIGVSALYQFNSELAHKTVKIAKSVNKDITTVMGGIYPTTSVEGVLKDKNVDFIIPGEGEIAFQEFLEFQSGKRLLDNVNSIDYRLSNLDNHIFHKNSSFIKDIDEIGYPDRSNLPIGKYSIWGRTLVDRFYKKNAKVTAIEPSRGCPFMCTYCSGHVITSRIHRTRDPKQIIKEIEFLRDNFNIEVITFNDENANVNRKWCLKLYNEMINANLGIKWIHSGGFYVHLMDEDLINKALESGLIMFNLAIESGSKRILRKVKKTEKIIDKAPEIINLIRKIDPNIYIMGFFIAGFPYETFDDLNDTINFAKKLDLDWALFNIFQPFPGSELYEYCINNGHLERFTYKNLFHYLSTPLKNMIIPSKEVDKNLYLANLEINFANSRTLRIGNYKQAIRDFEHIVTIAPDHALGHYCLSKAYEGIGRSEDAELMKKKLKEIVEINELQAKYLKHFSISID